MKKLVFILLMAISVTTYSQTEVPKDSFPPLKKMPLLPNEKIDKYLDFNTTDSKESFSSPATLNLEPLRGKEESEAIEMKLSTPDVYMGPPLESNTFTRYSFANDYSFYSGYLINDNTWISTSSVQNTYPTLGAERTVRMHMNYQPFDRMLVSGGAYASKYNIEHPYEGMQSPAFTQRALNDAGVTGAVKFILHDRIRLNAYGQYSVNQKENGVQGPMMGMFPQTYYGGTIEVKLTQKFGIEGGVIRELNPFNGKWVNRPYLAPVFYAK
jgi:hypothetical protein